MATQLLLIEDVECLGRSGEVVNVKPGFARNYLIPQGLAITANKQTLRQQERLKEERQKQADEDRKGAEEIAAQLEGITLTTVVKVDHDGHMYGSVTTHEVVNLLQEQKSIQLEKRDIQLKHPIKATGTHPISVKLKEGVTTAFNLNVISEEEYRASQEESSAK